MKKYIRIKDNRVFYVGELDGTLFLFSNTKYMIKLLRDVRAFSERFKEC